MSELFSIAVGTGSRDREGNWLESYFPHPWLHPAPEVALPHLQRLGYPGQGNWLCRPAAAALKALAKEFAALGEKDYAHTLQLLAASAEPKVALILNQDTAPASVPEAYLKLQLLSRRLCRPNSLNLEGLFPLLPNVAWTSIGPMTPQELEACRLQRRTQGEGLRVFSLDKFPPLLEYVTPPGVRIANSAQVRLGAWLGEGTTVMQAGFINFNAGTEGAAMVEGRVSAGVVVGADSDLGGGSSTMGTLSGGNETLISVGRQSLIGANAGIGISLGDHCTVEAGLYLTAGALVTVRDGDGKAAATVKARQLSGRDKLLFRRNSQSGALECLSGRSGIALNKMLHQNN